MVLRVGLRLEALQALQAGGGARERRAGAAAQRRQPPPRRARLAPHARRPRTRPRPRLRHRAQVLRVAEQLVRLQRVKALDIALASV